MIKNCGNCKYPENGCCYNCFGIESKCSEISTDFYCKNWKNNLELQKLFFDSELQFKIFFKVLNVPKGIVRDKIYKQLKEARTTVHNNLQKLMKKTILVGPELNIEVPYIKTYTVKMTPGKGRTCVLYFVPKLIRNSFMNFYFPETEILGVKLG